MSQRCLNSEPEVFAEIEAEARRPAPRHRPRSAKRPRPDSPAAGPAAASGRAPAPAGRGLPPPSPRGRARRRRTGASRLGAAARRHVPGPVGGRSPGRSAPAVRRAASAAAAVPRRARPVVLEGGIVHRDAAIKEPRSLPVANVVSQEGARKGQHPDRFADVSERRLVRRIGRRRSRRRRKSSGRPSCPTRIAARSKTAGGALAVLLAEHDDAVGIGDPGRGRPPGRWPGSGVVRPRHGVDARLVDRAVDGDPLAGVFLDEDADLRRLQIVLAELGGDVAARVRPSSSARIDGADEGQGRSARSNSPARSWTGREPERPRYRARPWRDIR